MFVKVAIVHVNHAEQQQWTIKPVLHSNQLNYEPLHLLHNTHNQVSTA